LHDDLPFPVEIATGPRLSGCAGRSERQFMPLDLCVMIYASRIKLAYCPLRQVWQVNGRGLCY
jgi:hypothetical protein